jgi:hypothetical protein
MIRLMNFQKRKAHAQECTSLMLKKHVPWLFYGGFGSTFFYLILLKKVKAELKGPT